MELIRTEFENNNYLKGETEENDVLGSKSISTHDTREGLVEGYTAKLG
jgi:hypothetical protein